MANTRLFDNWQIGMDLPAPFDRAIDGGVRYSTKEEDCSCYNKATRGKKATLFPVVLRAVLNLMRGGLNDGNIAAFYCMEYTKAYQGKAAFAKQKKQQRRARQKKETRDNLAKEEILQDDRFFVIAGYTSGGAPYGVTWEEMGLKPWEDLEENN